MGIISVILTMRDTGSIWRWTVEDFLKNLKTATHSPHWSGEGVLFNSCRFLCGNSFFNACVTAQVQARYDSQFNWRCRVTMLVSQALIYGQHQKSNKSPSLPHGVLWRNDPTFFNRYFSEKLILYTSFLKQTFEPLPTVKPVKFCYSSQKLLPHRNLQELKSTPSPLQSGLWVAVFRFLRKSSTVQRQIE